MSEPRKAIFVECGRCGERWKVATLPMDVSAFTKAVRDHGTCPNCRERKNVFMCPNEGPNAVGEARTGKAV